MANHEQIKFLKSEVAQLTESNRQLQAHLNLIKKYPANCNDGLPEIVDFVKMEQIEQERDQLREELEKVKALKSANGAEGNCISNTLHRRSKQMTEAGCGYDAHIMESGAQYLELEVEKSRKYYRALAAAKEALEKATLACCTYPVDISADDLKDSLVEFAETTLEPAIDRLRAALAEND